ncbi:hypothetical protein KP79_PYT12693 [Mizuhopecten yessoensis]|uniref:Uncharacterized protein n=1 Tax=Mizuhopecten yessoensis TaxID=6573 RepID=A0A210PLC2_MIZYE|nr:hypothetical protein KP79_PYT12693 [Mizuhopecten yessoensis]
MIIKDPKAELLLRNAIQKSAIYQNPADYVDVMAMDTFYVESFNNVLNLFHDKRIAFGNEEYILGSHMAVLHWNGNVDRPYSSIWNPPEAQFAPNIGPRHHEGEQVYKTRTLMYTWNIRNAYMNF